MQVGSHSQAAHHHMAQRNQREPHAAETDKPSRGDKIVARLDRDDDGKLSTGELKDTKLGRISVDRFARMDANEDGKLEAGELDAARRRGHRNHHRHRHHDHGDRHQGNTMENAVNIRVADYLAEKTPKIDDSADIASRLIGRLDGDASGALNSEEIAGTRLAEFIGGGFYDLDGDKNGALDKAELAAYLTDYLTGGARALGPQPVEAADGAGAITGQVNPGTAGDPVRAEAVDEIADGAADGVAGLSAAAAQADAPSFGVSYAKAIASAFETALEILKSGSEAGANPYDVVQSLYGDVQKILGTG